VVVTFTPEGIEYAVHYAYEGEIFTAVELACTDWTGGRREP